MVISFIRYNWFSFSYDVCEIRRKLIRRLILSLLSNEVHCIWNLKDFALCKALKHFAKTLCEDFFHFEIRLDGG